jgi:nucleoside-diphosphate-sugar epimerase
LITGISGLIGGIAAPELARHYTVCGLDLEPAEGDFPTLEVDITDARALLAAFRRFSPIRDVLHLAADPRADAPWESVFKNNIQGTWNIFQAASRSGIRRVVLASSNHVTGTYEGAPQVLHKQPIPLNISVKEPPGPMAPTGSAN